MAIDIGTEAPDFALKTQLEVTRQYDLAHPAVPFISHRATVIVDKEGKVAFCQVQEKTAEERNWDEVRDALARLS